MEAVAALIPAIILLVVGIVAIVVMRKLGQSPIVGYLLGGLLIGPHALGWIPDHESSHLLAELGVVFLLFDIGLHFSLQHIWETRHDIFGLGPIQIVLCVVVFAGAGLLLGMTFKIALLLGGALALSSTAVVIPTLNDRKQNNCPVGRTSTAVLIFQDVFAIFLLILASSMGGEGGTSQPSLGLTIGLATVKSALAVGIALLLGRFAVRPLFEAMSRTRNEEIFTALSLLIVLAMAAASGWAGLSLTLGAFLGGMMLAETPFRHLIQTEAKPFRNLLLAFFFISIGMSLDWRALLGNWWQILLFVVVYISIKALLASLSAKLVGWSIPGSLQLGFVLAQGSEFVFVIVSIPAIRSTLNPQIVSVVFIGVAISFALTSSVAELGNRLARMVRKRLARQLPASETTPIASVAQVVVYGMGDAGRTVADALEIHGIDYVAIESDYELFTAASVDGYNVIFGDLSDLRMAETMSMTERSILALTNTNFNISSNLTPIVQKRFPNLTRIATVQHQDETAKYDDLGMRPVVDDPEYPGLRLAEKVLESQNIDPQQIAHWRERREQEVRERLTP